MNELLSQHAHTPILIAQAAVPHTTAVTAPRPRRVAGNPSPRSGMFFGLSLVAFVIIALVSVLATRRMKLIPQRDAEFHGMGL